MDGSGSVYVTGRPALWTAFKGLGRPEDPEGHGHPRGGAQLFEQSGLRVNRVDRDPASRAAPTCSCPPTSTT